MSSEASAAPSVSTHSAFAEAAGAMDLSRYREEGFWRVAFRRMRRNRVAFIALIYLILLVLAAIFVPVLMNQSYSDQNYDVVTQGPSFAHWMGTDELGRDIMVRLAFGARISLTVGLVVQLVIMLIGVPVGLISGYVGGKTDTALMRVVDVLYSLPTLLFVVVIMTFLRGQLDTKPGGIWSGITWLDSHTGGLVGVYIGLGLIGWLTVSRIVRANVMSLKQKEFVEAARAQGASHTRIMLHHLLPNTVAVIVVAATLGIPVAILAEAGISFLGIGVIPPMPSWGLMISEAIPNMRTHPHMLIFPAVALSLTVLAFNFLGDGLRDALDPKMTR